MLKKKFEPIKEKLMGGQRLLRDMKLHDLYSSPFIIQATISKRMRWVGYVARTGWRRGA